MSANMWQFDPDAPSFFLDIAEEPAAPDAEEPATAAQPRPIGSELQSLWADEEYEEPLTLAPLAGEQDVRRVHWVDEEGAPLDIAAKSPAPATESFDPVEQGVRRVRDRLSRNRCEMRALAARIAALESTNALKTALIAKLRATIDARDALIEALEKQATTFGAWFNGEEF